MGTAGGSAIWNGQVHLADSHAKSLGDAIQLAGVVRLMGLPWCTLSPKYDFGRWQGSTGCGVLGRQAWVSNDEAAMLDAVFYAKETIVQSHVMQDYW